MKSKSTVVAYTETYKQKCFDAWYLGGRPNSVSQAIEMFPKDEYGRKPSYAVVDHWKRDMNWEWRADDLDSRALELSDDNLIKQKVKMLKKHQDNAAKVSEKALAHLLAEGFDSSAAAVNAYFRGTEEERKIQGFGELFEKLSKMNDADINNTIMGYLSRAESNNQIIDAEDIPDLGEDELKE